IQWCRTPEQRLYEQIRPVVLHGIPPAERAQETGLAESTLRRLKRWVEEGVRGLPDKSHANTSKPGVDLPARNMIRKKQEENPLLNRI
ncbi:MAG: hypothetical protein ACRDHW_13345, partial [Ktedonobacteraceae bacterium]